MTLRRRLPCLQERDAIAVGHFGRAHYDDGARRRCRVAGDQKSRFDLGCRDVVIARAGEPYQRLVPYREKKGRRKLGGLEGRIRIAPDFDETPPEVIEAFWNSKIFPDEEE